MSRRTWILGAPDLEMARIERILSLAGESYEYATADNRRRRVHPGDAYRADPPLSRGDVIAVECGGEWPCAATVDHHRPPTRRRCCLEPPRLTVDSPPHCAKTPAARSPRGTTRRTWAAGRPHALGLAGSALASHRLGLRRRRRRRRDRGGPRPGPGGRTRLRRAP